MKKLEVENLVTHSAVGYTPQSFLRNLVQLTPRCDAHRGASLRGGKHTLEFDSALGCTPWSSTPRRDAHRGVKLLGVHHTVESSASNILFYGFFVFFSTSFNNTTFYKKSSKVKKVV